ncbi:uncharacterized protein [Leptinotarsa decemlineata]|uniref:uncharacterized protein n=1 Tax=Leptinotarsa decemlineata TaxID=7539 RepID=UPI003D30D36C
MREEEKALTQTVHDVHHLEITCSSGHELKDNYSEDDDDSIHDPNYEAVRDESSSSDYEPTSSKHFVGDSDHVVADSDSTDTPQKIKLTRQDQKKEEKENWKIKTGQKGKRKGIAMKNITTIKGEKLDRKNL